MEPLTLFTWGYWGWGNATDKLVQAVDAVEAARGYNAPLFVDVRISRSVRAPGFNGRAFENTVGVTRYRWLDALGNVAVKAGGDMRIKDPAAAETLLDIAEACALERRRVVFFCACEFPGVPGQDGCCHRTMVAGLVLDAAKRRNVRTQVIEWPGGEPSLEGLELTLTAAAFEKVNRGATSIPLDDPVNLAKVAALPWCSLVVAQLGTENSKLGQEVQGENGARNGQHGRKDGDDLPYFLLTSGPARYKKGRWYLPIHNGIDGKLTDDEIHQHTLDLRNKSGFAARQSEL